MPGGDRPAQALNRSRCREYCPGSWRHGRVTGPNGRAEVPGARVQRLRRVRTRWRGERSREDISAVRARLERHVADWDLPPDRRSPFTLGSRCVTAAKWPDRWPRSCALVADHRAQRTPAGALPGGACDVGGDDISGVPVQTAACPVIPHRGARVRVGGGLSRNSAIRDLKQAFWQERRVFGPDPKVSDLHARSVDCAGRTP